MGYDATGDGVYYDGTGPSGRPNGNSYENGETRCGDGLYCGDMQGNGQSSNPMVTSFSNVQHMLFDNVIMMLCTLSAGKFKEPRRW